MAGTPMGGGQPQQVGGGQPQQANVYNQASNAYGIARNTTGAAINMAAQMPTATAGTQQASAQGYSAFTGLGADGNPMAGFGAGTASGSGYSAEEMQRARDAQGFGYDAQNMAAARDAQGFGYDAQNMAAARNVNAGQFAGTNIDPYMNPYTNQVVNQTQADMERARQIQQNQANDAMMQAGAFGGSRHGIANAETNRGFYDRLGATTGALRNQGYQNAQQAAFQDIGNTLQANLANQSADLTTNQFNAAAQNRAALQLAQSNAQANLANQSADLTTNQYNAAAQNRAASQLAQSNAQANLANQSADLTTNQYNAEAVNQARRTGANNATQASVANAGFQTQLAGQRMGAVNDAARFGAAAQNSVSQFNAGQGNQMNQFNANAINQGEQARFNNLMQGAQTFSGLADQGFGFGQDITRQQMQQGALTRQMNQQLIDAGRQQYGNYTNAGNLGLSPLAQFAGGNYGETTTKTKNPGLLGTIGAGAQLASAFCWVAREVYGQSNPEWLDFRAWMLTKAPAWLRKAYMKHGPGIAKWVKRHPWSKRILRPVMDWLKG